MASTISPSKLQLFLAFVLASGVQNSWFVSGQQSAIRRPQGHRNRVGEKPGILKDAFYEDNGFVVRIRTTYNQTSSITCNAVVMDDQLILSDITCIKYQGMANIDAKFVHVVTGEPNNETVYEVEQIYMNKADPKDPGTELALLRLNRPLTVDAQCRQLIKPEKNHPIEFEIAVRVIGYTNLFELKENRSRVFKRTQSSKYICTTPADPNETPGSYLLKGAPLLQMVDCRQYQLVGILTKTETLTDMIPNRKQQDCYVMVSPQMRWYEQVKTLTSLAAKDGGNQTLQPSVVVVTVEDLP